MGYSYYVNISGSTIFVYDRSTHEQQIGNINSRESFLKMGFEQGGYVIRFINSLGNWATGYISQINGVTSWLNVPYYNLDGKKWYRARYDMPIYKPDGTYYDVVKAGEFVWTDSDESGDNHRDYLLIRGYRDMYTKEWKTINGSYGYVDTGLYNNGSGGSYIGIYGNW